MPPKVLFSHGEDVHGAGVAKIAWDPTGTVLATCGANLRVCLWSRTGAEIDQFQLTVAGACQELAWDQEGEHLAVLQDGNSIVTLWSARTRQRTDLNTNLKDPTILLWSRTGPQLAVGTAQGNLLMYNSRTKRKVPIVGKHAKKIVCGGWNLQNKLALASVDRVVTVSDAEGATLHETTVKGVPVTIRFAEKKANEKKVDRENTLSMNMERRTVFMFDLDDAANPVELAFQQKYGDIVDYQWYGDGYLLAAFSKGFVVVISTHMKEIGEELNCMKLHDESMNAVAVTLAGSMFATCADDGVRVVDLSDWRELKLATVDRDSLKGVARAVQWTGDGQILTVATTAGLVSSYLISIPSLGACYRGAPVYLSSLREVTHLASYADDAAFRRTIALEIEPTFLAIGAAHIAVGMNNRAWIYRVDDHALVREVDLVGSVRAIALNGAFVAALTTNRQVQVVPIARPDDARVFPDASGASASDAVTAMALTDSLLICGYASGTIACVVVDEGGAGAYTVVDEWRHSTGIRAVYASAQGTRCVVIDDANGAFVFSPVDHSLVPVVGLPVPTRAVFWDRTSNATVFVAVSSREERLAQTFVYRAQTIRGALVDAVERTSLPPAFTVFGVEGGVIFGSRASNPTALTSMILASHEHVVSSATAPIPKRSALPADRVAATCGQYAALGAVRDAWQLAEDANVVNLVGKALADRALVALDVATAADVYRSLGALSKVMALERAAGIENAELLVGVVSMIVGQYDDAERALLRSSQPRLALDMRRDLLHWDRALRLAQTLAPHLAPEICRENAAQLEMRGAYEGAGALYARAAEALPAGCDVWRACQRGLARIAMHAGDVAGGRAVIARLASCGDADLDQVRRECGAILEQNKGANLNEAAALYVESGALERAAAIYIATKNYGAAAPLMAKITTPKLHAQYAKAKEREGDYAEAERAYEVAADVVSVVRLNLEHLEPAKAFALVRATRSTEGAALIAQFCRTRHDFDASIEFLILARRTDEAFQLADAHDRMATYAGLLGDEASAEQVGAIAAYYENRGAYARAAQCRLRMGQHQRALRLYLSDGSEASVGDAIGVVRRARATGAPDADDLAGVVLRYLSGEQDGAPKPPMLLFQLFVAVEDFDRAAAIATRIADDEQRDGRFKAAHDLLFRVARELVAHGRPVPEEIRRGLVLMHSYVLARCLSKARDHYGAARMLMRTAKHISRFGDHVVAILTKTVIECQLAGLKRSAFEYASMLMRPEYRQQIDGKYKTRIEAVVRRRVQEEDDEPTSPCPYCGNQIPETLLDCVFCQNTIPFCCASGKHMVVDEWAQCPECRSPALFNALTSFVMENGACPMCEAPVNAGAIARVHDPLQATAPPAAAPAKEGRAGDLPDIMKADKVSADDFAPGGGARDPAKIEYREAILNDEALLDPALQ
ncbi:unnamed protein product (mitochondrion) [Plasmodiophora brassicae]|uniref:Uncharacterized protein n=1 Tax=Plasmodiophora brassicae TaxID=37360 RepID=A0A3P3Y2Q7_PLABS|nr:unnamed protein product [Plasmodiophora brassicae]